MSMPTIEASSPSERVITAGLAEGAVHPPGLGATEPVGPARDTNVLVVDDSLVARRCIEKVLLKSGLCDEVFLAESGEQGLNLLLERDVDLVLSDVNMPGLSGVEFLTQIRATQAVGEVPIIMLTGEADFQAKLECLESGASDYVMKPFDDNELIARAKIHLQLKGLRDELRRKNDQLAELARLDSLTGIPNRRHFFEGFERELGRALRQGSSLTVAMIDIDHFKQVNDECGHVCGDQALARTAKLLKSGLREYDLIGRYGGEEFAAVFLDSTVAIGRMIAERCRRLVAEKPMVLEGHIRRMTVSIGVVFEPTPSPGMVTALISRADEALYLAKQQGRNRVVLATLDHPWTGDRDEDAAR